MKMLISGIPEVKFKNKEDLMYKSLPFNDIGMNIEEADFGGNVEPETESTATFTNSNWGIDKDFYIEALNLKIRSFTGLDGQILKITIYEDNGSIEQLIWGKVLNCDVLTINKQISDHIIPSQDGLFSLSSFHLYFEFTMRKIIVSSSIKIKVFHNFEDPAQFSGTLHGIIVDTD